jgi:hypothetical protein
MADAKNNVDQEDADLNIDLIPAKKKPGRPRKKVDNLACKINGISDIPKDDENILEMVHDNPRIFKKIFTLFRGYNSNEVLIKFEKIGFTFVTRGHLKKTTQIARIRGHLLNHYYCKEDIKICVRCDELEKIFCSFDRTHYRITFLLKEDYRSTLHIIVKDDDMDKIDTYEIELITKNVDLEAANAIDDSGYPLRFKFPSRHFKTQIRDISALCQSFSFRSTDEELLALTYSVKNSLTYFSRYTNKEKLELQSKVEPGDILSVTVKVALVKPFSNACIGDNVYIACDSRQPISFTTELDEKKIEQDGGAIERGFVCEIKVFTDISQAEV